MRAAVLIIAIVIAVASLGGAEARANHVRGADWRRAAVVRLLHQRRHDLSFLVRALPREPVA